MLNLPKTHDIDQIDLESMANNIDDVLNMVSCYGDYSLRIKNNSRNEEYLDILSMISTHLPYPQCVKALNLISQLTAKAGREC